MRRRRPRAIFRSDKDGTRLPAFCGVSNNAERVPWGGLQGSNRQGATMTNGKLTAGVLAGCVLLSATYAQAQDWPQWRGTNRDAKVTGFKTPKEWPKELKEGWKIKVGDGVATPALVGDKLYVFTHEGGKEVLRCLKTSDGSEIWKEAYEEAG